MISTIDIREAIAHLPYAERMDLLRWMGGLTSEAFEVTGVQEAKVDYGVSVPSGLSVEEYLRFEEESPERHEYLAGEIHAMSGVSVEHNRITFRLAKALSDRLRGGPCEVFITDLKLLLQIGEDTIFYYPDVMVACRPSEWGKNFVRNPKLVAEVLSPSTRQIDQREKSLNYHRTASIEEYLILSQTERQAFLHRRKHRWAPQVVSGADAVLELHSLGMSVPLQEIYGDVSQVPPAEAP